MYFIGIDIGTTSCKLCVLSSTNFNRPIFNEQLAHNAHIFENQSSTFDEQSPLKILETVETLLKQSNSFCHGLTMAGIQICGQMHGLVLWSSKAPRSTVSSLVTWQDQRCTPEFLASLGSKMQHLKTGYGLATLMWLIQQQDGKDSGLEKYDRSGTIADYITEILCENILIKSIMSTQMAVSWGAIDDRWPIEHRLLPALVEPGVTVGFSKENVPIYVALGDLQCSVFSCQPKENQGVVNISTSAQLAMTVENKKMASVQIEMDKPSKSFMHVPYFESKDLLVAASLNGGNVLAAFVQLLHSWQTELNDNQSSQTSIDNLWSRLIELGLRSNSIAKEDFSAALFGERHDPSMCAYMHNIRSVNISQINNVGALFRGICHWIVTNLFDMLGENIKTITGIIGAGSALMKNPVLQKELHERVHGHLTFNEHCDAAYGAALFIAMKTVV